MQCHADGGMGTNPSLGIASVLEMRTPLNLKELEIETPKTGASSTLKTAVAEPPSAYRSCRIGAQQETGFQSNTSSFVLSRTPDTTSRCFSYCEDCLRIADANDT